MKSLSIQIRNGVQFSTAQFVCSKHSAYHRTIVFYLFIFIFKIFDAMKRRDLYAFKTSNCSSSAGTLFGLTYYC